ncbi:MAG: hypothetical protein CL424_17420 [Acidimicrobiaceae bacterium]|nr:hypothetical protein [Acidimicrobiaceae bacterium]
MVVVSVSLIVTSIGSERFGPRVEPPEADTRAIGEAIMIPIGHEPTDLSSHFRFAGRLARASGGVLQPLVVITSTDVAELEDGRATCRATDDVLRRLGGDVDTALRIDRSVATGIHRASIESRSSLLYLPWPDLGGVRSWLLGAGYSEIVAASAIPTVVAGIRPDPIERIVVVARRFDLLPGRVPTLNAALQLAVKAADRDVETIVGPAGRREIEAAGVELVEEVRDAGSSDDAATWLSEVTRSGDLVVAPIDDRINSTLIALFDAGLSVVAVVHNQASQSVLSGSTLTFPVGGNLGPT